MSEKDLEKRIAALEAKMASQGTPGEKPKRASRPMTARQKLLAEIDTLEAQLKKACGESYMDDDDDLELGLDDEFDDDDDFDDEFDDELGDESFMDGESLVDDELVCASEEEPGIEDEITQDSLDEVEKEVMEPESVVTDDSMLETASEDGDYLSRLKSASVRCDRVAEELEKQGRTEMALRVDKVADAIDARIARMEKEAQNG